MLLGPAMCHRFCPYFTHFTQLFWERRMEWNGSATRTNRPWFPVSGGKIWSKIYDGLPRKNRQELFAEPSIFQGSHTHTHTHTHKNLRKSTVVLGADRPLNSVLQAPTQPFKASPSMGGWKISINGTAPAHKSQSRTACILFIYVYYKFYIHITLRKGWMR